MDKISLLYEIFEEETEINNAQILEDCSVMNVIKTICPNKEKDLRKILLKFPVNSENIEYRKQIAADFMSSKPLFDKLVHLLNKRNELNNRLANERRIFAHFKMDKEAAAIGGGVYDILGSLVPSAALLCDYYSFMKEIYSLIKNGFHRKSAGINALRERFKLLTEGNEIEKVIETAYHYAYLVSLNTSYQMNILFDEAFFIDKTESILITNSISKKSGKEKNIEIPIKDPYLNFAIINLLWRKNIDITTKMFQIATVWKENVNTLEEDLHYYEVYFAVESFIEKCGLPCCKANITKENKIDFNNLYDLALVCDLYNKNKETVMSEILVPNSFDISEPTVFISGINQGGKTVFLRSLIIACLFANAGLPIAAKDFTIPEKNRVYTFFPFDESEYKANSRFRNELKIIRALLDEKPNNAFMFMNEPFISTSEKEAQEVLTNLLEFFEKENITTFIVTHFYSLVGNYVKTHSAKSLITKITESGQRSYRLKEGLPSENFKKANLPEF